MEACFVEKSDYQLCDTPGELSTILNFSYGNHAGQAETVGAGEDSYTVIAHSRSGADFHIVKTVAERPERTCSPRDGGCKGRRHLVAPSQDRGADPRTTVQNR